mgnify:CR=1 FL=1
MPKSPNRISCHSFISKLSNRNCRSLCGTPGGSIFHKSRFAVAYINRVTGCNTLVPARVPTLVPELVHTFALPGPATVACAAGNARGNETSAVVNFVAFHRITEVAISVIGGAARAVQPGETVDLRAVLLQHALHHLLVLPPQPLQLVVEEHPQQLGVTRGGGALPVQLRRQLGRRAHLSRRPPAPRPRGSSRRSAGSRARRPRTPCCSRPWAWDPCPPS